MKTILISLLVTLSFLASSFAGISTKKKTNVVIPKPNAYSCSVMSQQTESSYTAVGATSALAEEKAVSLCVSKEQIASEFQASDCKDGLILCGEETQTAALPADKTVQ